MADVFKPNPGLGAKPSTLQIRVDGEVKIRIKEIAERHKLDIEEFCRQAIQFAIEHMEDQ